MPRPRIGKVPHWDNISPSEAKELRKLEEKKKKFAVMKAQDWYVNPTTSEAEIRSYYYIAEEAPQLVYHGEKVVGSITRRQAQMWVNMMR